MKAWRTTLSVLIAAIAIGGVVSLAKPERAEASVWDCYADVSYQYNRGRAWCTGGWGSYRVIATCNAPTYPYSITLYGPWVYRWGWETQIRYSAVWGYGYNCQVATAWPQTA